MSTKSDNNSIHPPPRQKMFSRTTLGRELKQQTSGKRFRITDAKKTTATLLLVWSTYASDAHSQQPADFTRHLQRGISLRAEGNNHDAVGEFEQAYQLRQEPRTLALLGLVYQAVGRWPDAFRLLSRAVGAPRDPWIRRNRASLLQALRTTRARVTELRVTTEPSGAVIEINGRDVGRSPITIPYVVDRGDVEIAARMRNYSVARRRINTQEQATLNEHLVLVPNPTESADQAAAAAQNSPPNDLRIPQCIQELNTSIARCASGEPNTRTHCIDRSLSAATTCVRATGSRSAAAEFAFNGIECTRNCSISQRENGERCVGAHRLCLSSCNTIPCVEACGTEAENCVNRSSESARQCLPRCWQQQ